MNQYICINGVFQKDDKPVINLTNRAYRYGDGFFETIRGYSCKPLLFNYHFQRIQEAIKRLKLQPDTKFTEDYLYSLIEKLLNKNKNFKGARIRLSFFRRGGGLYTPDTNELDFIIETSSLETDTYTLNKKGLQVEIFSEYKKQISSISAIKSNNALLFVLAGLYKNENNLDDCIILNDNGFLCETISSNLFIKYQDTIYTPPLTDGCVNGIMRRKVLELLSNEGIPFSDTISLTSDMLLDADEVFTTNAMQGVQWAGAFRNKRYYHFIATKLTKLLNDWQIYF